MLLGPLPGIADAPGIGGPGCEAAPRGYIVAGPGIADAPKVDALFWSRYSVALEGGDAPKVDARPLRGRRQPDPRFYSHQRSPIDKETGIAGPGCEAASRSCRSTCIVAGPGCEAAKPSFP